MMEYMNAIDLGHLAYVIFENGIDGHFFLQCSYVDLKMVGINSLQAKKISSYFPK